MAVDWKEISDKSTKELLENMADGCKTAKAVRLLANAIYSSFKAMDDEPDYQELITKIAFLSGVAVGALSDYADDLESREPKGD